VGVQQSHQSVITQVSKELIAKDLSRKFFPGDRVFWAVTKVEFVITLVTNDLTILERKMQRSGVNLNGRFGDKRNSP
jgi:hypothetical protein